jgi:hypothetical protein
MELEYSLPCIQQPTRCLYPVQHKPSILVYLPNDLFPTGFPTKILCPIHFLPHTCHIIAHLMLLYLITEIIFRDVQKLQKSSLRDLLQSPVTCSFLVPNTLLIPLFSNTLSLYFSLKVTDQVLHPYRQQERIQFCISYSRIYVSNS